MGEHGGQGLTVPEWQARGALAAKTVPPDSMPRPREAVEGQLTHRNDHYSLTIRQRYLKKAMEAIAKSGLAGMRLI
jgi:hypothetical protein